MGLIDKIKMYFSKNKQEKRKIAKEDLLIPSEEFKKKYGIKGERDDMGAIGAVPPYRGE